MSEAQATEDDFLGGRVTLRQPAKGYRVGADSILLAAAVSAGAGQRVLDVGCGTGAIAVCLAHRLPGVMVDGLELQPELAAHAEDNVGQNGLAGRVRIISGNLAAAPPDIARNAYDHVVTNPPYLDPGRAMAPPDLSRARAFAGDGLSLRSWVMHCLKFLQPQGWFHLVQRVDRLDDVLAALDGRAGDIMICPLWPRRGEEAKRFILRARKAGRGPLRLVPGLVLHETDGRHTAQAEAILRGGEGLKF